MSRGRKPTPTHRKLLRGNPGKRPLPVGEPQPARDLPDSLPHLGAIALREWHQVAGELHRIGMLTTLDATVRAASCVVYQRWVEAEARIDELLPETPNGSPVVNPAIRIATKALELMHRDMQDLGLTPSSRVRLATGVPSEGDVLNDVMNAGKRARPLSHRPTATRSGKRRPRQPRDAPQDRRG
jgi:P27 family predicted phage terminase small subunit